MSNKKRKPARKTSVRVQDLPHGKLAADRESKVKGGYIEQDNLYGSFRPIKK